MRSNARQGLALVALLFVTAIWGSTFILIKWTLATVDVSTFLFLRFSLATLLMVAIFWRRLRGMDRPTFKAGIVLGLLLATVYIAQTEGLRFTTASNSALITCLYMILVPLFVHLHSREKPDTLALVGIALALPGSILLTHSSTQQMSRGDLITGIVPIAAAWHIVMTSVYGRRHAIVPLVVIQFACTAIASGVCLLWKGGASFPVDGTAWLTIVWTALFASCVAFIVVTAAQRIIDPTRAGILFALEAVFAIFFAWWWGGETMTLIALAGAGLMIAGMVVAEIPPLARDLYERLL